MKRLVITAVPLIERWSVTSAVRRDRAEWPPSPDTLFSAFVAASASLGDACHPALYWLETLGNPTIEAADRPPMTNGIEAFSPVADRSMWEVGSRQARWHNSIGDPAPVSWSWVIETEEHLPALQSIAREVPYIGSSRGPVLVRAATTEACPGIDALVPAEGGSLRIRGLYHGRLDELEAAFQRGQRPRPSQTVGYARARERQLMSEWAQMIPIRRLRGQALHVAYCVPIAEAIRQAITKHIPDGASGTLTGHAPDGKSLQGNHIAVVPLPRVNDTFADGDVLGVGLMLPRGVSDAEYDLLLQGLSGWLADGGRVNIGRIEWTMEVAQDDTRRNVRETRYNGFSRTWASVTPVVFDRHPRRSLKVSDLVAAMCKDAGLPEPDLVQAGPASCITGAAEIKRHVLGKRDYLRNHFASHLRLGWRREVPGPILLGKGRYFGLGVMLPLKEAA